MASRLGEFNLVAPTRDGAVFVALLVGVLLGAVNTGNNLVYLVLGVLLGLLVVANLFAEWNLRALRVERVLPTELVAGVATPGAFRLTNPRGRGAARQVRLSERGEGTARAEVELCPAGRSVEVPADFRFDERGLARLGAVRVESVYPFGLVRRWRDVELAGEVLVYPCPADRHVPPNPRGDGDESGSRGRASASGEFAGLRPYRPGDPLRRVHWPTSARMATPMVVVRVAEGADEVVLTLDPALRGEPREEAIRRLAGRVERHLAAGDAVGLEADGARLEPRTGAAWRRRLLTTLALAERR